VGSLSPSNHAHDDHNESHYHYIDTREPCLDSPIIQYVVNMDVDSLSTSPTTPSFTLSPTRDDREAAEHVISYAVPIPNSLNERQRVVPQRASLTPSSPTGTMRIPPSSIPLVGGHREFTYAKAFHYDKVDSSARLDFCLDPGSPASLLSAAAYHAYFKG
jgi:hypothetical protein